MNENNVKSTIVVLSAGRSGTSLLMQILGKLGMALSENLLKGRIENPQGYFEDSDIVKVHKKLLTDLNSSPTLPLPDGWLQSESAKKARQNLQEIVKDRLNAVNTIWGFKDPRTCGFLPLWDKIFNSENIIPKYILAVRNPASVAMSLRRYIDREENITELQWLDRNCEALQHTASNCYIVHYEDWFVRGEEIALELLKYTGLDVHFHFESISDILQNLIKETLNRSIYNAYEVQNEYVSKLYDILQQCNGCDFDRKKLMHTVTDCRRIMHGFRGWYQQIHTLQKKEQNMSIHTKRQENLEKKISILQSNLDIKTNEVDELKKEVSLLKRQKMEKEKELKSELEKLIFEKNKLLIESKDIFDESENYRKRFAALKIDAKGLKNKTVNNKNGNLGTENTHISPHPLKKQLDKQILELKYSYSFRLGKILINAVVRPGKSTLLLPYYLIELIWDMVSGRGRKKVQRKIKCLSD